jgi:hypothetical protein
MYNYTSIVSCNLSSSILQLIGDYIAKKMKDTEQRRKLAYIECVGTLRNVK